MWFYISINAKKYNKMKKTILVTSRAGATKPSNILIDGIWTSQ
jgi:hypothetical protein|tara:strand:+ start:465 stop:593 length:129 start_codon:yes stop_codon:yes gene_type:complete